DMRGPNGEELPALSAVDGAGKPVSVGAKRIAIAGNGCIVTCDGDGLARIWKLPIKGTGTFISKAGDDGLLDAFKIALARNDFALFNSLKTERDMGKLLGPYINNVKANSLRAGSFVVLYTSDDRWQFVYVTQKKGAEISGSSIIYLERKPDTGVWSIREESGGISWTAKNGQSVSILMMPEEVKEFAAKPMSTTVPEPAAEGNGIASVSQAPPGSPATAFDILLKLKPGDKVSKEYIADRVRTITGEEINPKTIVDKDLRPLMVIGLVKRSGVRGNYVYALDYERYPVLWRLARGVQGINASCSLFVDRGSLDENKKPTINHEQRITNDESRTASSQTTYDILRTDVHNVLARYGYTITKDKIREARAAIRKLLRGKDVTPDFLRDIRKPGELSTNFIEAVFSAALTCNKVVLAFDTDLGKRGGLNPLGIMEELKNLKKNKKYAKLLENLIIITSPVGGMNNKLREYVGRSGTEVFVFARETERESLSAFENSSGVHAVYVNDSKFDESESPAYYPLVEIVTITIEQYLFSLREVKSKLRDLGIQLKDINISSISNLSPNILIFKLIPNAEPCDTIQLTKRYAELKRFIKAA
ncbi:MAG: hypothetical protein HQL28_04465, partial [Candidatus Omnitrophica bacterium]|nr:hypothetical protein [Candidatus Omnitrophota bacterium]